MGRGRGKERGGRRRQEWGGEGKSGWEGEEITLIFQSPTKHLHPGLGHGGTKPGDAPLCITNHRRYAGQAL